MPGPVLGPMVFGKSLTPASSPTPRPKLGKQGSKPPSNGTFSDALVPVEKLVKQKPWLSQLNYPPPCHPKLLYDQLRPTNWEPKGG